MTHRTEQIIAAHERHVRVFRRLALAAVLLVLAGLSILDLRWAVVTVLFILAAAFVALPRGTNR